jgi:hypothetical protein
VPASELITVQKKEVRYREEFESVQKLYQRVSNPDLHSHLKGSIKSLEKDLTGIKAEL